MVKVTDDLEITEGEYSFVTSRSGGPGGQNVNKVDTRVTLLFDLESSSSLSREEKELIRTRLPGRINKDGVLRVTSQRHRTQAANREAVVHRFTQLLQEALIIEKERRPTSVPAAAKAKRLEAKKRRQRVKRERSVPLDEDY